MIKDYLPVSNTDASISETAFIEDFWSQKWDQHSLPSNLDERIEHHEEFKCMQPFLAKLPAGSRLLDGGCGLGEWTLYFAVQGYQVVGLDLSQATIQKLKEHFPDTDFIAGDIRQTGFAEVSLDAYFSWGVFEHFEAGLGAPWPKPGASSNQAGIYSSVYPFKMDGIHGILSSPYRNGTKTSTLRMGTPPATASTSGG